MSELAYKLTLLHAQGDAKARSENDLCGALCLLQMTEGASEEELALAAQLASDLIMAHLKASRAQVGASVFQWCQANECRG